MIQFCMVNIGKPLHSQLTPFNAYVALSHSPGRDNICLLCGFDDRLFTKRPNKHLQHEDLQLERLDRETKARWEAYHIRQGEASL